MENASLIGLSRQVALRRQMDVIANNVANLGTAGFKAETMIFEEYVSPLAEWDNDSLRPGTVSYVHDLATIRDFSTGPIKPTGNPLDVALQGDGWLVVMTPQGERYTRNGGLLLNTQGELVTNEGHPVMGEGGPIILGAEDRDIEIGQDGTITTSEGTRGKLRVVTVDTNMTMTPEGSSLFSTDAEVIPAEDVQVRQGFIEGSNVRPVVELSQMIEVNRAYQSISNMLQRTDQLRRNAIQTLAEMPN